MYRQYESYSTEMSCFQSIRAVTAHPSASASDNSDDEYTTFTPLMPAMHVHQLLQRSSGFPRHLWQSPVFDNLGTLGEDGYAVFLREEFKPQTIILTAIVVSLMITAIVLLSPGQLFHVYEFNEHTALIFGYVVISTDLLAFLVLRPKNLEFRKVKGMSLWFTFLLVLYFYQLRQFPRVVALSVFLPCFSVCISLILLRMLAPDWTHPRFSLGWKEVRVRFLHWNKGAKQP